MCAGGGVSQDARSSQARALRRASRCAGHTSSELGPRGIPGSRDRQAGSTANVCISAPIPDFPGTLEVLFLTQREGPNYFRILIFCIIFRTWLKLKP